MNETTIWKRYEKSHDFIQKKGLVTKTEKNWNFYLGNQWVGMKGTDGTAKLPMMNFIKPTVKYKASTVAQHSMTAKYSDIEGKPELQPIYDLLNVKFQQSWEKGKMNTVGWKMVKAGAIQGDSYAYWGTDSTLDEPQILSNTAVLLGDENTPNIQEQPYILIVERLDISRAKEMAKAAKVKKADIDSIVGDAETTDMVLNKDEVKDKVTVILMLDRDEDGVVCVTRSTKTVEIEPRRRLEVTVNGEPVRGITSYPIVNYIWEMAPNSARGVSECECLIPNQIEVNKTLARRAITVKLTAFPRIAYDINAVENPEDLDKVGAAIGVNTGNAQSINQAIAYLNAANISSDADKLFSDLLVQSRELAGAGDTALGNIDPRRSSGSAIIAIRDQTQVPLNEQVGSYQQFVEDVALLWFDMWMAYDAEDFEGLDGLGWEDAASIRPSVRIDVSQDNQWTKLAEQQGIDNLLAQGIISFEEYAQLVPEGGAVPKGRLLEIANQRRAQQMQMQAMQGAPVEAPEIPKPEELPEEEPIPEDLTMVGGGAIGRPFIE